MTTPNEPPSHGVSFAEAVRVWLRVAALSFGGPAGQIAVMQRILVDEKGWISQRRFLHALNYCMLLPGPEAQQLATYIGWLLHRTLGGLVAGTLFVLPGFIAILALSVLYAGFGELALVGALFYGLKAAVLAIVVQALLRIGGRALDGRTKVAIAAAAFVAIFFFDVPFPWIVAGAALVGLVRHRLRANDVGSTGTEDAGDRDPDPASLRPPSLRRSLRVLAAWLAVWWLPVAALWLFLGDQHVFVREGLFFSQAAVVTFGGAYSVLAYIAQRAVEDFGWLSPGEMLDGLGMAETTPGPLIQVVQFVGFLGAYRNPGSLSPMTAGILGSIVTTWVTFAPCFLWIFLGAPYIEWLRGRRALSAALSAITAAVVGVILNLAVWFALHTLFAEVTEVRGVIGRLWLPSWDTLDIGSLVITAGSFWLLFRIRLGMPATLACAVAAGVLWTLFAGLN